jgi:glycerol-3-phosphate dehydrogenase (NAD+)
MYVFEETINGEKLTEIINTRHENVKYLPGHKLPDNVVAVPDVVEAAKDADILIFVVPHQFIRGLCKALDGKIKPSARAVSLIKGFDEVDGHLDLISNALRRALKIECAILMGANIAGEVADEKFCEATLGCKNAAVGQELKCIFQMPYFRITVVPDEETVEACGALKNIVAVGAGFVDGLKCGDNTKAAVIRLGLMEMVSFCRTFFDKNARTETFLESCGVADLITTCYSGRNRRIGEQFVVQAGKTFEQLETELLNGQKLQGPPTAAEVNHVLQKQHMEDKFPLFTTIHKICTQQLKPTQFIDCLQQHPDHLG